MSPAALVSYTHAVADVHIHVASRVAFALARLGVPFILLGAPHPSLGHLLHDDPHLLALSPDRRAAYVPVRYERMYTQKVDVIVVSVVL